MNGAECANCGATIPEDERELANWISGFSEAHGKHVTCCGELCFKRVMPTFVLLPSAAMNAILSDHDETLT